MSTDSETPIAGIEAMDRDAEIDQLRREKDELRDEVESLRQTVTDLVRKTNEMEDRLDGRDSTDPRSGDYYEDLTLIERYQKIPDDERDELLSTSKRRAIALFENWDDVAKDTQAGSVASTKYTSGPNGRSAIRSELQKATGEDLQWVEVYRAMKALAKLSVRDKDDVEQVTDEYGREHITGGAFAYHDKVNPDANGGKGKKFKILRLETPEGITLP